MKFLYALILFIMMGCDIKHDIILPMIDEGTVIGYDENECSDQELFCIEKNGDYYFNPAPEAPFMCSCTWGETDVSVISTYELEDLNTYSSTFGQPLKHSAFLGKAILYYFPTSDTWSLCKSRFDSLNELYLEYGGVNSNIIIIGVGKNDGNSIYTVAEDTVLPYIKETDDYTFRNQLSIVDRDVYFYNTTGDYVNKVNLTAEFNKSLIEYIIDGILDEIP